MRKKKGRGKAPHGKGQFGAGRSGSPMGQFGHGKMKGRKKKRV